MSLTSVTRWSITSGQGASRAASGVKKPPLMTSISRPLGNFLQYKNEHGFKAALDRYTMMDFSLSGEFQGEDQFGNKYYEALENNPFRQRYVVYGNHQFPNYDASSIPAEWHPWLHQMTEYPPTVEKFEPVKFQADHKAMVGGDNGTKANYLPKQSYFREQATDDKVNTTYEAWGQIKGDGTLQ